MGERTRKRFLAMDAAVCLTPLALLPARARVEKVLGTRRGDHVCLPYTADATVEPTLAAFLLDGLMAGERCFLATTPQLSSSALGLLHRRGVPVGELLQNGTLIVTDVETYYRPTGRFDAQVSLRRAHDLVRDTRAAGFAGLRGAGGPAPWESYDDLERRAFFAYEAEVGQVLHDEQVAGLCLYQRQEATQDVLQAMLASHGRIVVDGQVLENPLYAPSRIHTLGILEAAFGPGQTPQGARTDSSTEAIQGRNTLLEAIGRQLGRPVGRLGRMVEALERAPDRGELGGCSAGLFEIAEDLDRLCRQVDDATRFLTDCPTSSPRPLELGAVTAKLLDTWRASKATLPDVDLLSGARVVGSWDPEALRGMVGRMLDTAWQRGWGTRIQVEIQSYRRLGRLLVSFEDIDAASASPLEPGPNGASLDRARDELTLSLWAARESARCLHGHLTVSVWPSGRVQLALELPLEPAPAAADSRIA